MPVEFWNPVPIYFNDIPRPDFIALKNEISSNLDDKMYSVSEWGDLVQTTNKFTNNIITKKSFPKLEIMLKNNINSFLKDIGITSDYNIYNSWFNKLPKYGHQGYHKHTYDNNSPKNYFSGVYYYQEMKGQVESLDFELRNEMGEFYVSYGYEPGRILIFSSCLYHRVRYNKNKKARTSFSFNFKLI